MLRKGTRAGMTREEIVSNYQNEKVINLKNKLGETHSECHNLYNDYTTLLENGIQHFSKPPGLMSRLGLSDPDETMAYQIGYKKRELRHCTELKARLKKTRKRKRKKTRKRKKPVSKSKKINKSKKRNKSKRKKR